MYIYIYKKVFKQSLLQYEFYISLNSNYNKKSNNNLINNFNNNNNIYIYY